MFMQIAIGAIGIGITIMIGYLVIAQVQSALQANIATMDNVTRIAVNASVQSTQTTVFAGFGLLAVGIIVLAAFGLINVFQ